MPSDSNTPPLRVIGYVRKGQIHLNKLLKTMVCFYCVSWDTKISIESEQEKLFERENSNLGMRD